MKKGKIFTLLFVMIAAIMMPSFVNAASGDVAKVGDNFYTTLQDAIDNANGKEVVLLDNVTECINIASEKEVTLDLGGFTITNVAGYKKHTIVNNGTLTIKGNGTVDNVSDQAAAISNKGTLNINGGKYTRSMEKGTAPKVSGGNSYYVIDNLAGGKMTVTAGEVTNNSGFSSLLRNLGTLDISGGKFTNKFIAVKNDDNGVITMSAGEVTSTDATGSAIQNWGDLTITGGTVMADGTCTTAISSYTWDDSMNPVKTTISDDASLYGNVMLEAYDTSITSRPEIVVNGGEIDGTIVVDDNSTATINAGKVGGAATNNSGNINVNGGVFTNEPDATKIPENMEIVENDDGSYVLAYIKADYSKVNDAIDKAEKIKRSEYTSASLKKLDKAIKAVVYDKNITHQSEVDKMAKTILDAYAALEKKPAVKNPQTYDSSKAVLGLTSASLVGCLASSLYLKKKRFN